MNASATQIIKALGGTSAVSRMFGIAAPSVSKWKKEGIPRGRMMYLRLTRRKQLSGIDLEAATNKFPAQETARG